MVDGMKGGMASSKVSGIYHPHTSLFQSSSCNFHPSMDGTNGQWDLWMVQWTPPYAQQHDDATEQPKYL